MRGTTFLHPLQLYGCTFPLTQDHVQYESSKVYFSRPPLCLAPTDNSLKWKILRTSSLQCLKKNYNDLFAGFNRSHNQNRREVLFCDDVDNFSFDNNDLLHFFALELFLNCF